MARYFEIATIFLMLSALYLIYVNLGVRDAHKPSAYSVFNEGVKPISGSLELGFDSLLTARVASPSSLAVEDTVRFEQRQWQVSNKKWKRNDICFCGSGKKYKKCCGNTLYPVENSVEK
jgi:hypothetical protein